MTGAALVALLDGHHITDRALLRARDRAVSSSDPSATVALAREIKRYFSGVESESRAQLDAIDRKLDDLYQRQYNLHAERSVAVRRLELAKQALGAVDTPDGGSS